MAETKPTSLSKVILTNNDNNEQEVTLSETVTLTQQKSWGHVVGVKAGVETTFETGIPMIVNGEVTVSAEVSYEHNWGESETTSSTVGVAAKVRVPGKHCMVAEVVAKRSKLMVPYTATFKEYKKGQLIHTSQKSGVFENVQVYERRVKYHEAKPIGQC